MVTTTDSWPKLGFDRIVRNHLRPIVAEVGVADEALHLVFDLN